tara:strand:- start:5103 stop:5372 length:270 start_codon:yes stop_codon:yes gene_type:complete
MKYTSYKPAHNKYEIDPARPTMPKTIFGEKHITSTSLSEDGWDIAGRLAKLLNTSKSNVIELCLRYFENDKEELIYYKNRYLKIHQKQS